MLASIVVVAGGLAVAAGGDPVEAMARLDDKVRAIATTLEQPSPHMIEDATARAKDVRDSIAQLAAIKGTNSRAADVVAHYPKYADAVDAALGHLAKLTSEVHAADGIAESFTMRGRSRRIDSTLAAASSGTPLKS